MDPGSLHAITMGAGVLGQALREPPSFAASDSQSRSDAYQAGVSFQPTAVMGSDFTIVGGGARGGAADTGRAALRGGGVEVAGLSGALTGGGVPLAAIAAVAVIGGVGLWLLMRKKKA
jgi:hypothetical protein